MLFYLIYANGAWTGLVLLAALLLASTFTLLYGYLSSRQRLHLPILLLVAWGAVATSLNWAIRPHLVSMFFLAVWLIWTDDLQRGKKVPIWGFPAFMLLWSNLHGEFIAGILVLLAYAFGWLLEFLFDRSRANLTIGKNIWLALILSAIASVINPSGAGPWLSIVGFVNNEYLMSRMVEANAPDFQNPDMRVLFSLLAGSIILLAIKKTRLTLAQGFLLAGFSAMSLMAIRNIHLYGIVAPFVLAQALDGIRNIPLVDRLEQSLENVERQLTGFAWIGFSVTVLSFFAILNPSMRSLYQLKEPVFPVRAVEWLKANPQQGNMFNNLNWGGYLELELWPSQLPFIDSMSDTTGAVTMEYESVITMAPGWQEILGRYDIHWAILPRNWPLVRELKDRGWETIYQDETTVILVKK